MNKVAWPLFSLFLIISPSLFSQIEYYDTSFGNNGIVMLNDCVEVPFFQRISNDSEGMVYISFSYSNHESMLKLNPDGSKNLYFAEQGQLASPITNNINRIFQINNLILEPVSYDNIVRISDENGVLLKEVEVMLDGDGRFDVAIGKNNFLYVYNDEKVEVYNEDGQADLSFGIDGSIYFEEILGFPQMFRNFSPLKDGSCLLFTSDPFQEIGPLITKLTSTGELDKSFASNGMLSLIDNQTPINVTEHLGNNLLINSIIDEPDCPFIFTTNIVGYNQDGQIDLNFGNTGNIASQDQCFKDRFNEHRVFSSGQILRFNHAYSPDENTGALQHSSLYLYNQNGETQSNFGDEGKLIIESFPAIYISDFSIDLDDNVYLLAMDSNFENPHVIKLRADRFLSFGNEEDKNNDFQLINNPSSGDFLLQYSGNGIEEIKIELYDLNGRLITAEKYSSISFGQQFGYKDHLLIPATYMLKVSSKNGSSLFSEKVVIVE